MYTESFIQITIHLGETNVISLSLTKENLGDLTINQASIINRVLYTIATIYIWYFVNPVTLGI